MIYSRKDGTYVIEIEGIGMYHVIESDTEKWEEVQQRINNGEEVQPEIPFSPGEGYEWNSETLEWEITVDYYKTLKLKEINIIREKKLNKGFTYNEHQIACDEISQANANAFLTSDMAGLVSYPIKWRTLDNQIIEIADSNELKTFSATMLGYVQDVFQESWNVKDMINSYTTIEQIDALMEEYSE